MRLAEALRKQKMIECMSLNNGFSRFGKQRVTSHDHAEIVVTVLGRNLAGKGPKLPTSAIKRQTYCQLVENVKRFTIYDHRKAEQILNWKRKDPTWCVRRK